MTEQRVLGPRLFNLQEAEAQLPLVKKRLARFQDLFARYEAIKRDLSVLRLVSCSGGDEKNPDQEALDEKEGRLKVLLGEMEAIQQELLNAGCVPKSIQEGLVDFFALKDDRLVFLCWKQGEDRITAWHTLEGGFSGRMPIETFLEDDGESKEV
jgi:hypothetical protein